MQTHLRIITREVSAEKTDQNFTTQNSNHILVPDPQQDRCHSALEARTPPAILSSYIIDTEMPRGKMSPITSHVMRTRQVSHHEFRWICRWVTGTLLACHHRQL